MKLQEGKFYWVKFSNNSEWEIGRYKNENFYFTDGSNTKVTSCFDYNKKILKK